MDARSCLLSLEEYRNLCSFFAKHPDGRISEGIVSPSLRPFLPTHIQYALSKIYIYNIVPFPLLNMRVVAVPIFNIDKRPFALLCAYNASDDSNRFVRNDMATHCTVY